MMMMMNKVIISIYTEMVNSFIILLKFDLHCGSNEIEFLVKFEWWQCRMALNHIQTHTHTHTPRLFTLHANLHLI